MDIGITISIIGTILTLLFGLTPFFRKEKTSLTLKSAGGYCLDTNDLMLMKLNLHYLNKPISNPVILTGVMIKNDGKKDIDKNHIHEPIKIYTNDEFKILEAHTVYGALKTGAKLKMAGHNCIELNFDLIKPEETIAFDLLVELVSRSSNPWIATQIFYDSLKTESRITDIKKIKKEKKETSEEKSENRMKRIALFFSGYSFYMGIWLILTNYFNYRLPFWKFKDSVVLSSAATLFGSGIIVWVTYSIKKYLYLREKKSLRLNRLK